MAAAVDRILDMVSIPCNWAAESAIPQPLRAGWRKVSPGLLSELRRCAIPLSSSRPRATIPGKSRSGLDARVGKVAVEGWAETSDLSALDIARRFEDVGVSAIVYTDIARDGMLQGLNLDATIALADAISVPVIASGGLASIEDIRALLGPRARKLAGAIAGRALYDGRLDAAEALKLISTARMAT